MSDAFCHCKMHILFVAPQSLNVLRHFSIGRGVIHSLIFIYMPADVPPWQ